jgi:hypothetical protein
LTIEAEQKYATEAKSEMNKLISQSEDLRVDEDSFNYRLVTRFKSGKIVEMVFEDLGPKPRVTSVDTHGMLYREAYAERLRSIDSNMAFLANRAAEGFKPMPEEDYPEEIFYQAVMYAQRVILPPKIEFTARLYPLDSEKPLL